MDYTSNEEIPRIARQIAEEANSTVQPDENTADEAAYSSPPGTPYGTGSGSTVVAGTEGWVTDGSDTGDPDDAGEQP